MTKRYTRSSATMAEQVADRLDNRDEDVMQGLVTAGALVALADGRVEEVERDELLNFIDRQQLAPTIPRTDIAEVFDRRVQQLEDRDSAEVIIENLRPLVGLSLASVVLRTAQRVAAADRQIHSGELQALELIRLIMTSLSAKGLPVRLRTCDALGCESASDTRRFQDDLASEERGTLMKTGTCSLCKRPYDRFGHNAWLLGKGRCCDACNATRVIPARLQWMLEEWRAEHNGRNNALR